MHNLSEMQDRIYQEELNNVDVICNRNSLKSSMYRDMHSALFDARFEMIYNILH